MISAWLLNRNVSPQKPQILTLHGVTERRHRDSQRDLRVTFEQSREMDVQEILALFDKEQRIEMEYPDMRKEVLPHVVRFVRVQEAIERGYRFLTIDTSPMSRPIVARHGFRLLTYARDCEWKGKRGTEQ